MYSLFLDTHDKDVNIAVYYNDQVLDCKSINSSLQHSDIIMPTLKELLDNNKLSINDIKMVFVVNGPGSFTGVRLGVTIAKTLAYTLNIPIKTLTSLEMYVLNSELDNKLVLIEDVKGYYGGLFDVNNNLINDMFYKSKQEYNEFINNTSYNIVQSKEINYEKIFKFMSNKEETMCHLVNPIYIKVIEALKND